MKVLGVTLNVTDFPTNVLTTSSIFESRTCFIFSKRYLKASKTLLNMIGFSESLKIRNSSFMKLWIDISWEYSASSLNKATLRRLLIASS